MTCQYAPAINFQSLMVNAMFPAVYNNLLIFISDKYINPVNNCKGYMVDFILISELIICAHQSKS